MPAELAVKFRNVTKRYGDFTAVDSLDFDVPRGAVFGFLGPNGSGKSTSLRMLNDIIAPDEGTIELLSRYEPGLAAAAHIGYLPEERGLYPKMRVGDTLVFFANLRGVGRKQARKLAEMWLERLDLSEWINRRVQDLSKGMQQKVQFAVALIHDPELVVLDEPWSGLDPLNAEVLRNVVRDLRSRGKTVLFSTHLMEQAEQICDRVCIISKGKKVLEGALEDVRKEAAPEGFVALEFVEPEDQQKAQESVLAESALVAGLRERERGLVVELASSSGADELLASLMKAGLSLRRFETFEPTLHQIFIDRVGQADAYASQRGEHG